MRFVLAALHRHRGISRRLGLLEGRVVEFENGKVLVLPDDDVEDFFKPLLALVADHAEHRRVEAAERKILPSIRQYAHAREDKPGRLDETRRLQLVGIGDVYLIAEVGGGVDVCAISHGAAGSALLVECRDSQAGPYFRTRFSVGFAQGKSAADDGSFSWGIVLFHTVVSLSHNAEADV